MNNLKKLNYDYLMEVGEEPIVTDPIKPTEPIIPEEPVKPVEPVTPEKTEPTEPVKPVKEEPTEPIKPEEEKKDTDNVAETLALMKAQIEKMADEAKATKETVEELNKLKETSEQDKTLIKEYETVISDVLKVQIESLPEGIKELVPQNVGIKEQLAWLQKANDIGLFKLGGKDTNIEIGKPLSPKEPKSPVDVNKLSASSMLSLAYNNSNAKNGKRK